MNTLIMYGSEYGTAKQYAGRLSEITGIPVRSYDDVKSIEGYEQILYIGALYAGGVKGLKATSKLLKKNVRLILATVGLADTADAENVSNILSSLSKQLPADLLKSAVIFHLRGGIDYKKLNLAHRTMMKLLYNKAKGLPEEKKTAEVRAMIETYDSAVSFVDYSTLAPIVDAIK